MKSFALTFSLLSTFLLAQPPGLPLPPAEEQNQRLEGNKNPGQSSIPDPNAIHTPDGMLFEQPAMNGLDISLKFKELTGKRVLLSSAAAQAELSIIQPGPLTNQDIIELIQTSLVMEGFALIPTANNPTLLKLVPAAGGNANPGNQGSRFITEASNLPFTDEIITFKMQMNYIKPEEAVRTFQQIAGQLGPSSSITPVPNASSIIIRDNSELIRMLLEIKNEIDVPSAQVSQRFIELIYSDATELATTLNELLNQQNQNGNSAAVQRSNQPTIPVNNGAVSPPPGLNQGAAGASPQAGVETPMQIIGETRTNRILLMGRPVDIVFAESLIREFDQPSSERQSVKRKLRYLPVSEFMPIAAEAIERTLGGESSGSGTPTSNRANNNQNRANRNNNNRNNNNNNNNGGGSGGSRSGGAGIGGQDGETAPQSMLVGSTQLIGDNVSNSLIVSGPPHHIEIVQNLMEELDVRAKQIAITAVFGRYTRSNNKSFGVNLVDLVSQAGNNLDLGITSGAGTVFTPGGITTVIDALSGRGSEGLGIVGNSNDDFGFFIDTVLEKGSLQEVARPTVFTTNNRSATLSSGQRIAVPTGTFNGGVNAGQSTNIEFRDVFLELEVRPLVNSEEEVTLEISLVNDSLGENRNISSGADSLQIPDIASDELTTILTVPNKSVVMLGGFLRDIEDFDNDGIPLLSEIPLIKYLFSNISNSKSTNELVIMIYPRIIEPGDLRDQNYNYNSSNSRAYKAVVDELDENFFNESENGQNSQKAKKGFFDFKPSTKKASAVRNTSRTRLKK